MNRIDIFPKGDISAAGAQTGADISGGTYNLQATLKMRIHRFAGTGDLAVVFEDSVDAFTASVARAAQGVRAPVADPVPQQAAGAASHRDYAWKIGTDMPGLRLGTSSALLRLNVGAITGTVTIEAWIEY